MRLVLSRKGFDSAAGSCPSPVVDGSPVSLPIPTKSRSPNRYADLKNPVPELVEHLTGGKITRENLCHLDPDLDPTMLASGTRGENWRGTLGQVGRAQSHLASQGVGIGDLFLFWGLFRPVERVDGCWRYRKDSPAVHAIFGWLQVGDVLTAGADGSHLLADAPWLADHPHARTGWDDTNTLYIARDRLDLEGRHGPPSYGVFARPYVLTASGTRGKSVWQVPAWLDPTQGGVGMTFHPPQRWSDDGTLQAAPRGQEFVADLSRADGKQRDAALAWAMEVIESCRT